MKSFLFIFYFILVLFLFIFEKKERNIRLREVVQVDNISQRGLQAAAGSAGGAGAGSLECQNHEGVGLLRLEQV
jgi:hypothetical protein